MYPLKENFGFTIEYSEWNRQKSIPLYIDDDYDIKSMKIDDTECILLIPQGELGTMPYIKKQIKQIQSVDEKPVVLSLSGISEYRRKNMVENKIPFITDRQVFLPFLGTIFVAKDEEKKQISKFTYATQQLATLFFCEQKSKLYISEATKRLPVTSMSLSRAAKQLDATSCFDVYKDGVNKVIESKYPKHELFEKMRNYFRSPIQKKGYMAKDKMDDRFILSGESALAEYSMLGGPRLKTYAVFGRQFDRNLLTDELIDINKQVAVEVWGYDPKEFSETHTVDRVSLVISLLENKDERIEGAVEELVNEMWSE